MSDTVVERVLLPTDVVPTHYGIALTPNFVDFTFKGVEDIEVNVVKATKSITLHSFEIEIDEDSIQFVSKDATKAPTSVAYDTGDSQSVTFTFDEELPVGTANLKFTFTGQLNDKMCGFYRSKYVVDGKEEYLATTQFEPTDGRRAFPCWDEPAHKATFTITLTVASDLTALSNTPVDTEVTSDDGKLKTLTFERTPKMSTYIVAFVVGKFDHVESVTSEGVKMRVYTQRGRKEQGQFALDVATKILTYYSQYFAIAYPLPKMDMIAIPDFSAGAMENWGLVTYRDVALLVGSDSGVARKKQVAYTVAHELAHMWFGNLVTMQWWKELWLNEGFATYMGNKAVDEFFKEWDIFTEFASHYSSRALQLDALRNSHPIEVDVANAAQINEIFDAISYCKGAAVIYMINDYIGDEAFQKGLQVYLARHKYSNTVTLDLWQAWSESSGRDVAGFMGKWTSRTGFPVISIAPADDGKYTVKQTRFFSSGDTPSEEEQTQWNVWLSVQTDDAAADKQCFEFNEAETTIDVKGQMVKANIGQAGFFRVHYAPEILKAQAAALAAGSLSAIDRLGTQNDVFALSEAGLMKTSEALAIARSFSNETDYTVLTDLMSNLRSVAVVWSGEEVFPKLKKFIRDLFEPIHARLGWEAKEGESDLDKLLRAALISTMGGYGHQPTIEEAKRRFALYRKGELNIPGDQRASIFQMVVTNGNEADYEEVLNVYKTAEMQEDKIRALSALARSKDLDLIDRTLAYSLSDDVRAQDTFYVFGGSAAYPAGRQRAWEFVQNNWTKLEKRFADGFLLFGRIIQYTTQTFSSLEKADEIEAFFKTHPVPAAERTIKQSLETVRSNAKWLNNNRDAVATWLNENVE
eukprot:TRINITY_DN4366_c0_g2_i1.p1 TRINITY_DN4366_c0_g2~~TRINITY_DN4366_c0_g2_i1.p1  ORF type:complete len:905 (-),score=311.21 TRINITY_DN4366_c0_g2_i1:47-2638(-)